MKEMRKCRKCGCKIEENGLGNRIKIIGKETFWKWINRHIRQLFSIVIHGFVKPEIEEYDELCDTCFVKLYEWLDTKE